LASFREDAAGALAIARRRFGAFSQTHALLSKRNDEPVKNKTAACFPLGTDGIRLLWRVI